MTEKEILDKFYAIFRGNELFYVKHQPPFHENESGKLTAKWFGFALYNRRNRPPEDKEEGDLIPVTRNLYKEHLNGGDGLAIAPITNTANKNNVCFFAVIDIDVYDVNFTWLISRLYRNGFKFAAFRSKSGGLHIYFFFSAPEAADKAVRALERIVEVYGLGRLFVNEQKKSKVEIFPKQTTFVPGEKNAGCIFLPFYNTANKSRQNMVTAEGKLLGIVKALPLIEDMFTSVKEINRTLDELPYSDAPYCVQMLLLSGALGENDGRNNFLFSAAIYLKKKYNEAFQEDALQEMNDYLEVPLEKEGVESTYRSVTTHGYDHYACKNPPCAGYCDKKLCALREYGVGRLKNNHFTGADCWGEIYRMMAAQPYYLWKVRVNPEDAFREVRVENEKDLHNQAVIQESCWRDLNWAPFRVKDNDWTATVNKAMVGIEERQIPVPRETDTTVIGELYGLFIQYLTHRRSQNGQPYTVRLDQVYYTAGVYYFTTKGIMAFLRHERFSLAKVNLREQLIACGCSEAELRYKTPRGEEKIIRCWKKSEDEELRETEAFYEDVYNAGMELLQNVKPKKEREEDASDEGVKF
jgi:hypothetical protein